MPLGSRVRANNAFGVTTDNPLAAGATAFNSTQLILLPAISVGQHAIVVLDPKRVFGQPEIVVVTDHVFNSTTATITRGTYGTVARSHPVGTAWAHVAVDEDYIEILTSTGRPTDPYIGQEIYETDTASHRFYDGVIWNSAPPVGTLLPYLGATAPSGYLLANGAAVLRTGVTADLFAVVGTTYGVGDGVTTFNLPNMNGRVPVGRDAAQAEFDVLGEVGGVKSVTLTQVPVHTHGVTDPSHNHGQNSHNHTQNSHDHGASSDDNQTGDHRHSIDGDDGFRILITHGAGGDRANNQAGGTQTPYTFSNMDLDGAHNHDISTTVFGNTATNQGFTAVNIASGTGVTVNQTGVNEAHTNLQPYITVNYLVKI